MYAVSFAAKNYYSDVSFFLNVPVLRVLPCPQWVLIAIGSQEDPEQPLTRQ